MGRKPPITSCRSGAVVDLLRANGTKVPATLRLSVDDSGDRLHHVVHVAASCEEARLDGQRLVLSIGRDGRIGGVNPGATKAVFGFEPQVPIWFFVVVDCLGWLTVWHLVLDEGLEEHLLGLRRYRRLELFSNCSTCRFHLPDSCRLLHLPSADVDGPATEFLHHCV